MKQRAIFLDRDGTLNHLITDSKTGEIHAAFEPAELAMLPGAARAARRLQDTGYLLFIASNQPDYAKGKVTLENLHEIARLVEAALQAEGATLTRALYCYHHPRGVVPELTCECSCRKPRSGLLLQA